MTPRIRHNDYGALTPPELGGWEPRLTVSVIIAAYGHQAKLDLTLAALAAQSYPRHLMEVIVVDDGTSPPLRLPSIAPDHTRLLRTDAWSRGRSNARNTGLEIADGDVVHWLDADMVTHHDEVEAHMRWHHLADYLVVMGYVRYVDEPLPAPAEVHAAVSAGAAEKLFDLTASEPHRWIVDLAGRTDDLRAAKDIAYRVHVTNAASVNTRLLRSAGPLDTELVLGEDTELGYRLAQHGAAFVLEPEARSWHLGKSMMMRDGDNVSRYNKVFVPDKVANMRWARKHPRRQYLVPYLEVVVDASDATYEDTRATVDGVLASGLHDLRVTLVGPWGTLPPESRRTPQDGPAIDLRLVHGLYRHDGRVRYTERVTPSAAPTPYRLVCPPGWVPETGTLRKLVKLASTEGHGLINVALDETDTVLAARLEHTGAFARARLLAHAGEDLDDVVADVAGTYWLDGRSWGFHPAEEVPEDPVPATTPSASAQRPPDAELKRLREENARLEGELARLTGEVARLNAAPPRGRLFRRRPS